MPSTKSSMAVPSAVPVPVALVLTRFTLPFPAASDRQPNSCDGNIPISRASADTFAPGSRLRATIAALNSSDHRRRRATGAPSRRSGTASIRWKLLSARIVANIEHDTRHQSEGAKYRRLKRLNRRGQLGAYELPEFGQQVEWLFHSASPSPLAQPVSNHVGQRTSGDRNSGV